MAKPTTFTFGNFIVYLESSDSPGVYSAPCGLTSKAFNQQANTQETSVPDCTNPDAPAWIERGVDTLSSDFQGSGILAQEAYAVWQRWFESAAAKSVQIYPMGAALGYYGGQFLLTGFNKTVERGQKVRIEVTLQSDGQIIWNGPGSP